MINKYSKYLTLIRRINTRTNKLRITTRVNNSKRFSEYKHFKIKNKKTTELADANIEALGVVPSNEILFSTR